MTTDLGDDCFPKSRICESTASHLANLSRARACAERGQGDDGADGADAIVGRGARFLDLQCCDGAAPPKLGSLKPGSVGDATLISVREGQFDYVDAVGEHLTGNRKIVSEGVVIGGRWWHPK